MGMHSASGGTRGGVAAVSGLPVPRPRASVNAQLRTPAPHVSVVSVTGEVDGATEHSVRQVLRRALAELAPVVVVDLRRVTFCDSAVLELLVSARLQCRECGEALRLVRVEGGCLDRVLDLAGLREGFALFACLSEAMQGPTGAEAAH